MTFRDPSREISLGQARESAQGAPAGAQDEIGVPQREKNVPELNTLLCCRWHPQVIAALPARSGRGAAPGSGVCAAVCVRG